jgi:hypothetical protein
LLAILRAEIAAAPPERGKLLSPKTKTRASLEDTAKKSVNAERRARSERREGNMLSAYSTGR